MTVQRVRLPRTRGNRVRRMTIMGPVLLAMSAPALAQDAIPVGGPVSARGFIEPAGPIAAAQLAHFSTITLLMLLVVVPIFVIVPFVLLRYRRGGNGTFRPEWEFNWGVETVIWGVPVTLIVILATALWTHTRQYDPYRPLGPDPLVVDVVSLDWKFLFLYPEQGVATVDLLALPQDRPVTLRLTSGTVMQSFMVPQLAGQIYAMAGMMTQLNLLADRPGDFVGRNTQYNGDGFATQSFVTRVMPEAEFDAFVAEAAGAAQALDWAGYETLLEPSVVHETRLFSAFEPGLFERVIASFAPQMIDTHHHGHAAAAPAPAPSHQHHSAETGQ